MDKLSLKGPVEIQDEIIQLEGSKSISNRILIIRALSGENFAISKLSKSDDTVILDKLLRSENNHLDTGHAGTTFRFLTAYLAIQPGTQVLTGSSRMLARPIGPLVDALNQIGADIVHMEKPGYPPLQIRPFRNDVKVRKLQIRGDISSQYISALLMISPVLRGGLTIDILGELVSTPYVQMTLQIMHRFGIRHIWKGQTIIIAHQPYIPAEFTVEADWSAASYHYSIANSCRAAKIGLNGLFEESLQGDSAMAQLSKSFGIQSRFDADGTLWIEKDSHVKNISLAFDFILTPDLAQTVAVMCAAQGIDCTFSGLKTLKIKETDRIAALTAELQKFGVSFGSLAPSGSSESNGEQYHQTGRANSSGVVEIKTYKDHRMAMAFAPLAQICPIEIEDPQVVAKSYPGFWKDLETLGFQID